MRIHFLCGDRGVSFLKHNGAAAQVRSLASAFAQLGHDVMLLTPSDGGEDLQIPIVRIPHPECANYLFSTQTRKEGKRMSHALGHLWNNIVVEQTLLSVCSRSKPDLLFEVYSPYGIAGIVMARKLSLPHILNVHAPLAWEGAQFRQQALQDAAVFLEDIALQSATCIVTNSKEMKEIIAQTNVSESKIAVVPNGVDPDLFSKTGSVFRNGYEGKFVIGFVGSLKAWHGLEVLMEAYKLLATDPDVHLLVVGDGPMMKPLLKLSHKLPGRITLTGAIPQSEVPAYLRSIDIALAPYPPLDPFYFSPLKVLEYMAAGRPVIASDIGQLKEIIRHGETGLLTEPGNAGALADTIRLLMRNDGLRESIGLSAAREVALHHTWLQRASDILSIQR